MTKLSYLPYYEVVLYLKEPKTGIYHKQTFGDSKRRLTRFPNDLALKLPYQPQKKFDGAGVIQRRDRFKSNRFKFMTKLRNTDFKHWFAGILQRGKSVTLCIFHFSHDKERVTVFFLDRYNPQHPDAMKKHVSFEIPTLLYDYLRKQCHR